MNTITRLTQVRGVRGEKGATLLEFAFVSILFMMLTAGMMELGRGVWIYNSVSHMRRAKAAATQSSTAATAATPFPQSRSRTTSRPAFRSTAASTCLPIGRT